MTKIINLKNISKPGIAPLQIRYCESFLDRLRGFTFRHEIGKNEGLVLVEKRDTRVDTAIHMLFVWTDLAVFWVDSSFHVVDKVLAKSWHPFYGSQKPAQYVIEISPERLADFEIGDQVVFKNV